MFIKGKDCDRHHRICKSKTVGRTGGAVVWVPKNSHEAYHHLFQNYDPPEVAKILNEFWINPNWIMVAIPAQLYHETLAKRRKKDDD